MSSIAIVHGSFCSEEAVCRRLAEHNGMKQVAEGDVVERASRLTGMAEDRVRTAFTAKTSIFNKFTREKERAVAALRLAVAELLAEDRLIFLGFPGLLIPPPIKHVLRVCLIAPVKYRAGEAVRAKGISEKEAIQLIHKQDRDCAAWVNLLFEKKDPWDDRLYDIVVPMDRSTPEEAVNLLESNIRKLAVLPTAESQKRAEDLLLAARVEVALAKEGHAVRVKAEEGSVTVTINKQVLMLNRLEEEIKSIISGIQGIKTITTRVGKRFHQADIYRKYDFQMPGKVLLVDDEREFVQTLSERLLMRDVGSTVVFDGESALDLVQEDEPEVMILDLKMPGIDGIEVLRRLKATHPDVEVIILTGHGSDADRKVCMELGAFAYLQKPVDIDVLSGKLKEANKKIQKKKEGKE